MKKGKIWKNSKLNSELIWKIQKKSKSNSEKFGKYGRKWSWIVKRYEKKYGGKDIKNMEEKNVE